MVNPDNLSGRTLRWEYIRGFPLLLQITENGLVIGQIFRENNNEPNLRAELAGIEWQICDEGGLRAKVRIGFADGSNDLVVGRFERGTSFSHLLNHRLGGANTLYSVMIDGVRRYALKQESNWAASWAAPSSMVTFEADEARGKRKKGLIRISKNALTIDLPPLVLLGTLMAFENRLFVELPEDRPWWMRP